MHSVKTPDELFNDRPSGPIQLEEVVERVGLPTKTILRPSSKVVLDESLSVVVEWNSEITGLEFGASADPAYVLLRGANTPNEFIITSHQAKFPEGVDYYRAVPVPSLY